jgi:peptidoglycan hydrolase CwlO-like protein
MLTSLMSPVQAQDSLQITESIETMSQGRQNGFQIIIPQNSAKDAESLWKKFMRDETKTSVKKEYNEMVLHTAVLKSLGSDVVSVYAAFKEADSRAMLSVFVSGADSVFISSATNESLAVSTKLLVRNYAVYAYKEGVSQQLRSENKKLKDLEDELKDLEKNISSSENQIKKNNREIGRQKDNIKTLQTQEEFTTTEVLKQKQLLTTFSGSPEARKIDEKKLRQLEKDKKKVGRSIEKANRKIDKLEDEIKSNEKAIDKNKNRSIPEKKAEIKSQKEVTSKIERLLDSIR